MKKDVKLVRSLAVRALGLVVPLFGMAPLQAGTIPNGIVLQLGLDNGATDVLFISVDGSKSSSTPCSTNATWDYILPLNSEHAKRMYAMLLTARVSGTPVTLAGSSACPPNMDIENLHAVYY